MNDPKIAMNTTRVILPKQTLPSAKMLYVAISNTARDELIDGNKQPWLVSAAFNPPRSISG